MAGIAAIIAAVEIVNAVKAHKSTNELMEQTGKIMDSFEELINKSKQAAINGTVPASDNAKNTLIEICNTSNDSGLKKVIKILNQEKLTKKDVSKIKKIFAKKYHPDLVKDEKEKQKLEQILQFINEQLAIIEKSIN